MSVRIASFNCENLFARFRFRDNIPENSTIRNDDFTINDLSFQFTDRDMRLITGNAIKSLNADVIALQEVEKLDVLERFRNQFLGGSRSYPHIMLIDGNDPRFIDVGVLSRFPIVHARSYQHLRKSANSRSYVFSRDCLEVDIAFEKRTITLFVNHFKSMMGGRANTRDRRLLQVRTVRKLIEERFGKNSTGDNPFIVLGDFNDYIETGHVGESSLSNLVRWNQVENVVDRLDENERWTHFYAGGNDYRQLDYILVSNTLKDHVTSVEIERRGMPKRATRYDGSRFRGVGKDNPKASDHCPVLVELNI